MHDQVCTCVFSDMFVYCLCQRITGRLKGRQIGGIQYIDDSARIHIKIKKISMNKMATLKPVNCLLRQILKQNITNNINVKMVTNRKLLIF